jgi:hypothetical protein
MTSSARLNIRLDSSLVQRFSDPQLHRVFLDGGIALGGDHNVAPDYVIPNAFIAAVMGSEKKMGSTRSTTSPETSRKFRLFSRGTNARRAPLSMATWNGRPAVYCTWRTTPTTTPRTFAFFT